MDIKHSEASIKTKQELMRMLAFYKAFLTQEAVNYLISLINMEFSVFADNKVSGYDRRQVAGTTIFKEITLYSLTNILVPLFSTEDYVIDNYYQNFTISKMIDKSYFEILSFFYNFETKDEVFGTLSINHYLGYKEAEIKRIENEIYQLKERHEKYRGFTSTIESLSYNARIQDLKYKLDSMSRLKNDETKAEKIKMLNSIGEIVCREFGCIPSVTEDKNVVLLKKTPGVMIEQRNQRV